MSLLFLIYFYFIYRKRRWYWHARRGVHWPAEEVWRWRTKLIEDNNDKCVRISKQIIINQRAWNWMNSLFGFYCWIVQLHMILNHEIHQDNWWFPRSLLFPLLTFDELIMELLFWLSTFYLIQWNTWPLLPITVNYVHSLSVVPFVDMFMRIWMT